MWDQRVWGHRYLGIIASPTAGSKSRELGALLLLDSNLFPILSSPTGFETCQTSKDMGFDSFSESRSSEGSKRFWSAGYHVFLAKHQVKLSNPHRSAGFLTTPTVRTGRELVSLHFLTDSNICYSQVKCPQGRTC